uniref:Uncharacterized protein n=1 Tax=Helianthus annuus TaxID=4232 RepID=A0A251TV94_HELAN
MHATYQYICSHESRACHHVMKLIEINNAIAIEDCQTSRSSTHTLRQFATRPIY